MAYDTLNESTLSYLDGILDGEGCISTMAAQARTQGRSRLVRVQVSNTFKPVLTIFQQHFGGTVRQLKPTNLSRKAVYHIEWRCKKAETILRALLPYLVIKREQATLALAMRDLLAQSCTRDGKTVRMIHTGYEHFEQINTLAFNISQLNGHNYQKPSTPWEVVQ